MLDLITQSQIWNFLLEEVRSREIGLLVVSHTDSLLDVDLYGPDPIVGSRYRQIVSCIGGFLIE